MSASSSAPLHEPEQLQLAPDARSATDVSVEEAVDLDPSQIKGPTVGERLMDELGAVVSTAKEAVQQLLHPSGQQPAEQLEGTK